MTNIEVPGTFLFMAFRTFLQIRVAGGRWRMADGGVRVAGYCYGLPSNHSQFHNYTNLSAFFSVVFLELSV